MLDEYSFNHNLFITRHAIHASKQIQEDYQSSKNYDNDSGAVEEEGTDVAEYCGLVAMVGDGIMYDMMQIVWTRGGGFRGVDTEVEG